jgi:hypothetical protein
MRTSGKNNLETQNANAALKMAMVVALHNVSPSMGHYSLYSLNFTTTSNRQYDFSLNF